MRDLQKPFLIFFTVLLVLIFSVSFFSIENVAPAPYTLKYNEAMGKPHIPFNNPLTKEGVWLGRLLFYDTLLSGNNKQSCGTCHIQQYAFTDGRALAIGTYGDTVDRNTMSLVNLAWGIKFFWDGRARSLEELIRFPVTNKKEMAQDTIELVKEIKQHKHYPTLFSHAFPGEEISMNTISKAIAQFLRTLVSQGITLPDSIFNKSEYAHADSIALVQQYSKENSLRGSFTRMAIMCSNCHSGLSYGGATFADNHMQQGIRFKASSLINVMLTAPYTHDGRFTTIAEVLQHYDKHISELHTSNPKLIDQPLPNLINYFDRANFEKLFSFFTDSSFITNPAYANPFVHKDFNYLKPDRR
jgi:cytochrome c peroxidase